jgi:hypothetical protein
MEAVSKPSKKKQQEPGPELPVDETQAGVQYIDFSELQPIENVNEEFMD